MIALAIELSAENLALAKAEAIAAAEALGGAASAPNTIEIPRYVDLELPSERAAEELARRLAFSRRVLRRWEEADLDSIGRRLGAEAARTLSTASIRPFAGQSFDRDPAIGVLAQAWKASGGSIDLDRPNRRFYLGSGSGQASFFGEEIAVVDRRSIVARRMGRLPFQRPVSLAPRLARAAANLARVRPGDRVADPFVGTGALLVEAALLGARVSGVDKDPAMIRGAIRNFAHAGIEAERLLVADAADAAREIEAGSLDSVLTDPPYGRASRTHGEEARALVERVLPTWAERIRPGGRLVVVLPGGPDPVSPPWRRVASIPDRVHRSLTREFRIYERS